QVCCFLCFDDKPLDSDDKEKLKSNPQYAPLLDLEGSSKTFKLSLKESCGLKCAACTPLGVCGIPACVSRKAMLNTMKGGMKDYSCCQGHCSGCGVPECKGSTPAMLCEGCCCPVLSLSFTRIEVMQERGLTPDKTDYQLMRCSNCLQAVSAACSCIACILSLTVGGEVGQIARLSANITEAIACCFTFSVAGCMYVQVMTELDLHKLEQEGKAKRPLEAVKTGMEMNRGWEEKEKEDAAAM
ncbi:hypothetical protein TL16_g08908, partial [Triparma laevis f. inornata]